MSKNLFRGRIGALVAALAALIFFGAFYFDITTRNIIWTLFFIIYGIIYLVNFMLTQSYRYLVSAIAFFLASIVALINTFFIELFSWRTIWISAVILLVLSAPIAALLNGLGNKNKE